MARLVRARGAINGGLFLTSSKFPDGDWTFEKALNIEGLFQDSVYLCRTVPVLLRGRSPIERTSDECPTCRASGSAMVSSQLFPVIEELRSHPEGRCLIHPAFYMRKAMAKFVSSLPSPPFSILP